MATLNMKVFYGGSNYLRREPTYITHLRDRLPKDIRDNMLFLISSNIAESVKFIKTTVMNSVEEPIIIIEYKECKKPVSDAVIYYNIRFNRIAFWDYPESGIYYYCNYAILKLEDLDNIIHFSIDTLLKTPEFESINRYYSLKEISDYVIHVISSRLADCNSDVNDTNNDSTKDHDIFTISDLILGGLTNGREDV